MTAVFSVEFASLDVVCFLISMCMFIVSKVLLTSIATVIVRAGGAILLEPICYVFHPMLCCLPLLPTITPVGIYVEHARGIVIQ